MRPFLTNGNARFNKLAEMLKAPTFKVSKEVNQIEVFGARVEVRIEITLREGGNTDGAIVAYRLLVGPNGEKLEPRTIGKCINFDAMGLVHVGQKQDLPYDFTTALLEDLAKEKFSF